MSSYLLSRKMDGCRLHQCLVIPYPERWVDVHFTNVQLSLIQKDEWMSTSLMSSYPLSGKTGICPTTQLLGIPYSGNCIDVNFTLFELSLIHKMYRCPLHLAQVISYPENAQMNVHLKLLKLSLIQKMHRCPLQILIFIF